MNHNFKLIDFAYTYSDYISSNISVGPFQYIWAWKCQHIVIHNSIWVRLYSRVLPASLWKLCGISWGCWQDVAHVNFQCIWCQSCWQKRELDWLLMCLNRLGGVCNFKLYVWFEALFESFVCKDAGLTYVVNSSLTFHINVSIFWFWSQVVLFYDVLWK